MPSTILRRMALAALAAATATAATVAGSAAQPPKPGDLQQEFSGLAGLPADLQADDVTASLPGRWAVMLSDIVSEGEPAYGKAIVSFCTRQPWVLKAAGADIAGLATRDVGVVIRRGPDAGYLIELDRDQYYAHLGLTPVDPADPNASAADRLSAARTDAGLRRSSSFFRYSADVLVETDPSGRRIWRRCPDRP